LQDNVNMSGNQFSAAPSLLGYMFQCRVALLESIRKIRDNKDFQVWIETLDDVAFESNGTASELLQLKHHINKRGDLTDSSPDLWKTVRIWSEGYLTNTVSSDSALFLITTSEISANSIASYLKSGSTRNIDLALQIMNSVAATSTNRTNALAYESFKKLSLSQKTDLLNAITIEDSYPSIGNIDNRLKYELFYAVEKIHLTPFIIRLEGWWLNRVILQLTATTKSPILSDELNSKISELREQFKQDNLPIDDDIINSSIDNADDYANEVFVNQLKLIQVNNKRILFAILNYYRAFNQRTRWIKDDLLMVGELAKYEKTLKEEWEVRYAQMLDDLGTGAAENEQIKAAQALYKWVESGELSLIRPGVREPSIARGSYQILSNELHIGWHPEFQMRLKNILGVEEEQA